MEYFKFKNDLKPQKGSLLISEPFLPDPNFERTVILLCEHNEEGSFGFVLNKVSPVMLDDIMNDIENFSKNVYIGGPVQPDTLHFIHRDASLLGSAALGDGLFWGGDFDQLIGMIENENVDSKDYKFFVGYSGWDIGQLENEIGANSWIVVQNATPELVFDTDEDELWKTVLKDLGGRYSLYSNYPIDPRLN